MLRRKIRLTREYLYRKSLEGKQRLLYEKKCKIREALEEGKPIPTELRNEEASLRQEIDLEDENTAVPRSHIDDEYANASQRDPKILLTTSRDPSALLIQFAKMPETFKSGSKKVAEKVFDEMGKRRLALPLTNVGNLLAALVEEWAVGEIALILLHNGCQEETRYDINLSLFLLMQLLGLVVAHDKVWPLYVQEQMKEMKTES